MEFRVLGPVQVSDASGVLELGSGKQVTLLACLLLDAGRVVSRDRLIDALWGERPPASAANALQVHVHALRQRFGQERVVREGPGYRIVVAPDELDVERFTRLAARGRAALAAGDPAEASAALHSALDLWRGPAFEDVRYAPFAQAELAQLEELHLAALEDRIDADLALGRHGDLVPELEALVSRHPGRERLARHLMLALYRCDQQAAALDAFARAREALQDDLGLEPGPALQELQRAILRHDPSLRVEPPELRARRHLPAPETSLTGRGSELADLAELLRGDARLVTLTGTGGIGKTRLAIAAGYDLAEAFADGVYFVDLSHLTDPALVPDEIARTLGLEERGATTPLAALHAHLAARRVLVILDNFEVVDAASPLVSELLRAAPRLSVLATSRTPLRLTGEHQYRVLPLQPGDAARLFVARANAVAPSFRQATEEADEVIRLCRRLDCLPLAIELAAARTRDYAPLELLEAMPVALDLASAGARDRPARQQTLRATIAWSFRLLTPEEQTQFTRLAVFAGGFPAAAAAAVCGAGRDVLASLVGGSLLHERVTADRALRYYMLGTVREYALELLSSLGEADAYRRRHAEHFTGVAEAADEEHPASRSGAAWRALEAEQDNFRAALAWCRDAGATELQLRLAGALAYFWATSDHLREGRARLDEALSQGDAAPASLQAGAQVGAALLAHSLGDYTRMRDAAQASLDVFRHLGDDRRTALALNQLGIALSNLGDIDGGIAHHEEGVIISRRLGDGLRLAAALNNLGYCLLRTGNHDRARELFEEGLAVSTAIDHHTGEAAILGNLGLGAILEHRPADALDLFEKAIEIDRDFGYTEGMIYDLAGIASAVAALGDADEAAHLMGAARAAADAAAVQFEPLEGDVHGQTENMITQALGATTLAAVMAAGREIPLENAIERALRSRSARTGAAPPPASRSRGEAP